MRLPAANPLPLAPTTATPPARIEEAARGLEEQFARMLIQSMRSASMGDPLLGDNGTYRDMYDQQLAKELTRGRGLGLAPIIARQLERSTTPAPAVPVPSASLPLRQAPMTMALPPASTPSGLPLPAGLRVAAPALAPTAHGVSLGGFAAPPAPPPLADAPACDPDAPLDCSTPEAFVRSLWPHAQKTAAELGVPAKALVAQAALETGWGRRLAGGDSHNLFGIKAGGRWHGERVRAGTHEFVDGVRVGRQAEFRAYGSPAESFADYAQLLSRPRYAAARNTGDTRRFAQALQHAGYATDPSYAAKIAAIADGPTIRRALAALPGDASVAMATPRAGHQG
ncbi:flagellar assembly peptidoglycan hydrolase FlgJ [Cognatiluteimonas weifangensis]|uniref:Peptidoglycan hydrolase FlgJ n=1 Tax=Cognatiluteimonas weifangensis TaxID=2303539 RepID=A0A372DRD9_9GAMM|nr:flagellar assembly peptidoglycan hydrolase FlgJ [Luteimonas weifangensis]RFP62129.1 flagellar assembly peptidoglycan hydrolase FlgJ [Luteimonas weifangensis]